MTRRHGATRMTLGFRMALLPALLAAAVTMALVGTGTRGLGVAEALGIGALVLVAIALPIDLLRGRADRAHGGTGHARPGRRRRAH